MTKTQIERKYNVELKRFLVGSGARANHKWYWKCTKQGITVIGYKKTLKDVKDALEQLKIITN
ncbi:hypothetical protein [Clostridium cuniculi]|uniref:hypothetical protein n=1 Tax=Clostridium cuniculi TaxID=2548455 RepID=UPI00105651B9|nr:hypothetical protein [Clostridium cuniculi]